MRAGAETPTTIPAGKGLRVALVVSRFNQAVSQKLLEGAQAVLVEAGVAEKDIEVFWVPGAFELPSVAARLAEEGEVQAIIALGAVIRGETPHFDYICQAASTGLAAVGREYPIPTLFGLLTTDTLAQAEARAGGEQGHLGREAALAALTMAALYRERGWNAPAE